MSKKLRRSISIAFSIGLILTMLIVYFSMVKHPLPHLESVASIKADVYQDEPQQFEKFEIAAEYWAELWDSLQPATHDFYPAKWSMLGRIEIKTKNDSTVSVGLYVLKNVPGAFSIGPWYYRGGNSDKMLKVIKAAYQASLAAKP